MNQRSNHALEFFFENTVLVAHCKEMPEHMLVCYKATDKNAMQLAMDNANARYGQGIAVQEDMGKIPDFVGFWLPEVATPLHAGNDDGFMPEPQPTDAAAFLNNKVKQQKIPEFNSTDFTDLHKKLPEALLNATVLHTSISNSSFNRYN